MNTKPKVVEDAPPNRDDIRAQIFSSENKKAQSKLITVFGVKLELKQPSLGEIIDAQAEEDRKRGIVNMLIRYAFVPETNERVFEEADFDSILGLPFGDEIGRAHV